ncbi:hypothetical protein [Zhihengliuella halotolerans]|uniref:hypothetical protein n=1 Tax=Zhihengliuella halotolerans TaxID=370736 RepID=UPI000C80FC09|nr:hypothetical protein [Zhihengliuella halotolerans]
MNAGPNVLSFTETIVTRRGVRRVGVLRRRKAVEMRESVWNIQVDGKPLQGWIRDWTGAQDAPAEMADLHSSFPAAGLLRIDHLLGLEQGPGTQRVGLLFCPICRNEACGYLSCEIDLQDDAVTWTRFGWEDTVAGSARTTPIAGAETLSFDPEAYREALLTLRRKIAPVDQSTTV